jgi:hypothetical protein
MRVVCDMQMVLLKPASAFISPLTLASGEGWDASLVGLLIIGCILGIPGVMAWVGSSDTGLARMFQAGPALLIPAAFLWTLVSHYSCRHEVECSGDLWRTLPLYGLFGAALLWNVALVRRYKERSNFYIPYAIIFVPTFYVYCMFCLVLAIKFPL